MPYFSYFHELQVNGKQVDDDESTNQDDTDQQNNDNQTDQNNNQNDNNTEDEDNFTVDDNNQDNNDDNAKNKDNFTVDDNSTNEDDNNQDNNDQQNDQNNDQQNNDNQNNNNTEDEDNFTVDDNSTNEDDNNDQQDGDTGDEEDSDNPEDAMDNDDQKAAEDAIYGSLSDAQKNIRLNQLKLDYKDLYETIVNTLDSINHIPGNEDNVDIINRLTRTLTKLKKMLVDYLKNNFSDRSYLENYSILMKYMAIFRTVTKVIDELNNGPIKIKKKAIKKKK